MSFSVSAYGRRYTHLVSVICLLFYCDCRATKEWRCYETKKYKTVFELSSSSPGTQPRTSTDPAARPASAGLDPAHTQDSRRASPARTEQRKERRQGETRHRPHPSTHVWEPAGSRFSRHDARFYPGGSPHAACPLLQAAGQHVQDRVSSWRQRRRVHCQAEATAGSTETSGVEQGSKVAADSDSKTVSSHELTTLAVTVISASATITSHDHLRLWPVETRLYYIHAVLNEWATFNVALLWIYTKLRAGFRDGDSRRELAMWSHGTVAVAVAKLTENIAVMKLRSRLLLG